MEKQYKILVVEDDKIQAKKLQYVLEKYGYATIWAEHGQIALDLLSDEDNDIFLIISDYQMPVMNGLELLEKVKADAAFKKIPFIVLTTINDENVMFEALKKGANEFLNKPFKPEELKLRCHNMVLLFRYQRLLENENFALTRELTQKNNELATALSELQKTHEEFKQMEEKLIIAAKLASLGKFSAGMAHEINNPVTIINGNNVILKKLVEKNSLEHEKIKKISEDVGKAVSRITEVISHLRDFSAVQAEPNETINPCITFAGLKDLYGALLEEKKIKLIQEPPSVANIQIIANKSQFEQIIINLLFNAVEAMEKSPKKELTCRGYLAGDKFHLEVCDTGCGIAEQNLVKIYDPFFTTKTVGSGPGLGMGLSVVRTYVVACGGEIECFSEVNKGTTFKLTFNVAPKK